MALPNTRTRGPFCLIVRARGQTIWTRADYRYVYSRLTSTWSVCPLARCFFLCSKQNSHTLPVFEISIKPHAVVRSCMSSVRESNIRVRGTQTFPWKAGHQEHAN